MKIFSNFNTKWKEEIINEVIQEFGQNKMIVLSKSKLFLFYKSILPLLGWTILLITMLVLAYFFWEESGLSASIYNIYSIFVFVLYLFTLFNPLKHYIDYKMDFSIVTPRALTRYNQEGIFKRDIKTSNVRNIKTISIKKNNFLYNLFDNGDLIFLSEGNVESQGEIALHFIYDPEEKKKKIIAIMSLSSSLGVNE